MKELSNSLANLVALLNDGHYHDGTTLGKALNITRSAVWKAIQKLMAYGIKIDAIKGTGYALLEPLILLNQNQIESGVEYENINLHIFETLNSTNEYLHSLIDKGDNITICLAEQQTKGKGRLNRPWHSPFGQNIYLSCSYRFHQDISELAGLSLIVSLAITKVLETYHLPKTLLVKWPNDIYYEQQKLTGILIELKAESNGLSHAIIGIGINVNMMQDEDERITQSWTALRKMTGVYIDRNELCIALINNIISELKRFEIHGLSAFIDDWHAVDYLANKNITLKQGDRKIQGQARGINQLGHLVVKLANGQMQTFSSGDATIVK